MTSPGSSRSRRDRAAAAPPPVDVATLTGWFVAALPESWFTRGPTVRHDADEILVLNEGYLVERGTHAELMMLDGVYASMYQLQAERMLGPSHG